MILKGLLKGLALCAALAAPLCPAYGQAARSAPPLDVFVTAAPQQYLVERIGGERVHVSTLVPPGADAHSFEPKPAQMLGLARASLYFSLGGLSAFEDARLPGIEALHPRMRIVDLSRGIARLPEEHEHEHGHGHGHDDKEHGGRGDPHIWTSPRLMAEQARTVCAALTEIDPAGTTVYAANLKQFSADVARLDAFFRTLFADRKGMRFLVFHPAWGYFAADYGLVQLAVEVEGKEPKAADLARLISLIRKEKIPFMLVSPQISPRGARMIADEAGIALVEADPLAKNWLENMRSVGQSIARALR